MGPTLCALAAGLLVGQVQDFPTIQTVPANSGSAQVQTTTQTTTKTQTGNWTPSKGWVWQDENGDIIDGPNVGKRPPESGTIIKTQGAPDNPNIFTRITDKVGNLFSSKQNGNSTTSPKIFGGNNNQSKVTTMEPPLLEVTGPPLNFQPVPPQKVESITFQAAPVQKVAPTPFGVKPAVQPSHKIGHRDDYSWITGRLEIVNGAYFVHYAAPDAGDRFGGRMILSGNLDLSMFHSGDVVTAQGSVLAGRTISLYRTNYVELLERTSP